MEARQGVPRATIYDIARHAGVSHQTVSRFLRGFEGIRPGTRARVEDSLRELNYRPNMAARSLATNNSHRIGALAYEVFETGPGRLIQGASRGAREAGYVLDIVSLDPADDRAIESAIQLLDQNDLAGIIASAPTERVRQALLATPFAVPIYVEGEVEDLAPERPQSLNGRGARLAVDHLVEMGHRRLLYISGPSQWFAARNGAEAYRAAMQLHGLPASDVLEGDWSAESGFRIASDIAFDSGVTAIVAGNDQMALGVLRSLRDRGIAVPSQVSVTGFDATPESQYFSPRLTTVSVDFDAQGRHAIDRLLAMIAGGQRPPRDEHLHVSLVERESTSKPPG